MAVIHKLPSHFRQISLSGARHLTCAVNKEIGDALWGLGKFSRLQNQSRFRLYFAEYEYGSLLIGPRSSEDLLGGFLPPCGNFDKACPACKRLFKQLQHEWPLFLVLNRTAEEFLEDSRTSQRTIQQTRAAATRLIRAGQILGLSEALNALIDPDYPRRAFRAPMRKASAGIRSAYVTAPVGDKQLKNYLKAMKLELQDALPDPSIWDSDWDDLDFLRATSEVALAASKASWTLQVIVIPLSWLRSHVYQRGHVRSEAHDLLFQLFKMAWKESRGLRSESIRQLTLSQTARGIEGNTNADLIVQRLLMILRGDAPGFRPAALSDERLPMTAIWQLLLGNERLQEKFFPANPPDIKFPGLIEPFSLDPRSGIPAGTFFYYPLTSFEQLGHSGHPEDEIETMEQMDKLLKRIKLENPDLLGPMNWQFFASPAPLKDRSGNVIKRVTTVSFSSAHDSDIIHSDFSEQLRNAAKFMSLAPDVLLSKPPRKGFMRRFIRVSFGYPCCPGQMK